MNDFFGKKHSAGVVRLSSPNLFRIKFFEEVKLIYVFDSTATGFIITV